MATFTSAASRVITRPNQRVTINGTTRHDVDCLSISQSLGMQPAQAVISLPFAMLGDDLDAFTDAEVIVYAHDTRDATTRGPVFRGFLDIKSAAESAQRNVVTINALSPLAFLDRVYVGQLTGDSVIYWYKRHKLTGAQNGWTFLDIIQDLFAILPTAWQSVIGLGSIVGLSNFAAANAKLDDVVLTSATYEQALRMLLDRVPGVGMRERFTSSLTRYDFFPIGSSGLGNRTIRIPDESTGPESGAFATAIVERSDVEQIYSRVIAYGRPQETMVTTSTLHSTAPLIPAWTTPITYPSSVPAYTSGAHANELAVMADPDLATPGSPTYSEAYSRVFRVFRLPDCIRLRRILNDNVATVSDGGTGEKRVEMQVFTTTVSWSGAGVPAVGATGTETGDTLELVHGARITEDGFLILPRPALNYFGVTVDVGTGLMKLTYKPVHVYVTLTVQEVINHGRQYDTGIRGDVRLPNIGTEGTVLSWTNNACQFQQIATGNATGEGLTDANGEHYFSAIWYDSDTGTWLTTAAGSESVTRDDGEFLQQDAEQALAERSQRRTQCAVELPALFSSIKPGDMVRILGRGIDGKLLQVQHVNYDPALGRTNFRASDQVPWADETMTRLPDWRARSTGPSGEAPTGYSSAGGLSMGGNIARKDDILGRILAR